MQKSLNKNQLQQELEKKYTSNFRLVLQDLLNILFSKKNETYNEVILLSSRINSLDTENRRGVVTRTEFEQEEDRIRIAVQDLIPKITEEEATAYYARIAIQNKILILCIAASRTKKMEDLFHSRFYKQVEVKHITTVLPIEEIKAHELIIYDNFGGNNLRAGIPPLLSEYLDIIKEEKNIPFLYFGANIPDLNEEYGEDIYFSNSKFSIHARIQEMLLYLRHEESLKSEE